VAASVLGDAEGGVAATAFGDAEGAIAVTGTGDATCTPTCLFLLSGTGETEGYPLFRSASGCETGRLVGTDAACMDAPEALP
jgi:hypothetical protein